MDENQIDQFLNRPILKRLDDQAREELRSALRQEKTISISDDVDVAMASIEKNHRAFSENVIKPVLKRFQERQNQKHKQERISDMYKNARFKMYILLAVILSIIACVLLRACGVA